MNKLFKRIASAAMAVSMCMPGGIITSVYADNSDGLLLLTNADMDETGNARGQRGMYDYEMWNSYPDDDAELEMSIGNRGAYNCKWSNATDCMFMTGHRYCEEENEYLNESDIYMYYRAAVDCDGYYTVGVDGFMNDASVEFLIIDDWGTTRPCGTLEPVSELETETGVYDVYKERVNFALCSLGGLPTYMDRYWSVRREKLSEDYSTFQNKICISDHIDAWKEAGLTVRQIQQIMLNVEPYESSGKANVLANDIYYISNTVPEEEPTPFGDPVEFPDTLNDVTFTQNVCDERGGYTFGLYKDLTSEEGDIRLDVLDGGKFSCQWTDTKYSRFYRGIEYCNSENITRSVVRNYNGEELTIDYAADIDSDGSFIVGSYGWLNHGTVEYYIVDGWKNWQIAPECEHLGTVSIDDGIYELYKKPFNGFYTEIWSVRRNNLLSADGSIEGNIDVTKHLYAWVKYGLDIVDPDSVFFCISGLNGTSGSAAVTKNIVSIDGEDIAISAGIVPEETTEPTTASEEDLYIPGDLNYDLSVDSFDLIIARKELIKAINGENTIAEADIDCSGATKINDLVLITRIVLGDEVSVPKTRPQRVS
ncbi:glycoside hydrolase family 11 protein [uncultured Ruminococcus sp.]|uniref:glycoside hydrolase family 11 protein n=1 Tax=uncultured Ruminococcus sp. TaxID=165186 RepID=UPI00261577ED|nr:glycoside hydrolase family 11 protein [uncultured Ruminococcus sp.]